MASLGVLLHRLKCLREEVNSGDKRERQTQRGSENVMECCPAFEDDIIKVAPSVCLCGGGGEVAGG